VDIHFAWQAEYGVVSFGAKMLDMVVRYAKNQRKHHSEGTAMAMLERDCVGGECGAEPPR